jgi:alkylation response protein AidB-like acyl-CoA dehydrogenase
MVSFELSEEQQLIQQTSRDFADRELKPRAAERDRQELFPREELQKLAELGLMGVNIPGEYGGAEAGVVAYSLAITELARGCAATAVTVAVTNMVAEVVVRYGSDETKRKYLPRIVGGEYICSAFGLSEPHCGSDAAALRTTARRASGGWVLNGSKQWISHGDHAGAVVIWARTNEQRGAKGISAFLVENGSAGLSAGRHEDKMGLRGSSTVPLTLEDCFVPEGNMLAAEGEGFKIAMTALDGGRIGVASQALGLGQAAFEEARRYAEERQAFGGPLSDLEAIQFMLADCKVELDAAKLLTLRAAWLKEHKQPFTRQAAMAKLYSAEAANRICYRALQIHGGYGYTKEYAVERLTRDARVTSIYEGTSEIQRLVIGRDLVREH